MRIGWEQWSKEGSGKQTAFFPAAREGHWPAFGGQDDRLGALLHDHRNPSAVAGPARQHADDRSLTHLPQRHRVKERGSSFRGGLAG